MGLDCSAEAIVGVLIERQKIIDLWTIQEVVPGCEHPLPENMGDIKQRDYQFCHLCGAPLAKNVTRIDYDLKEGVYDRHEFHGLKIVTPAYDYGDFVVGLGYIATGSHQRAPLSQIKCLSIPEPNNNFIDGFYRKIKGILEPLGLWNEGRFGIHVVQHSSY